MKILFFFLLFSMALETYAFTSGRFVGMQFLINMTSKNRNGTVDEGPRTLFEYMNVPVQDSFLGPGKSLAGPSRILNFICAHKTTGDSQCSIYIHASQYGKISTTGARFYVQGEAAQGYIRQFHVKEGFVFENEEGNP